VLTRRTLLRAALATAGAGVAAACGGGATRRAARPLPDPSATTTPTTPAPTAPPPDPRSVRANEVGVIPVLMHHRLVDKVEGDYDMTAAWFTAELERLHREGYYPVTTLQVARGDLGHVPAGRSPVVLTFDDSTRGQMHLTPSGDIAPDSAAGILLDFAAKHPDFPAAASFYLNKDPFALGDPHRAVQALVAHGFEVGNHTFDHVPLTLPPAKVQQQLGELAAMVTKAVPGVAPRTMALPLGVEPSHPSLVRRGSWRGTSYVNEAVLLVGANPAHSPFHREWNAGAVPRIRSASTNGGKGEFLMTWWLDEIRRGHLTRYVAAGNPGHVTVPKAFASHVAPAYRDRLVTY
jgi:peptidoglycan/xylan/chitin deacetylase (PgdA/CDA1 family)